jgi:DNA invertase Pin-like site-specific DNA recombinase
MEAIERECQARGWTIVATHTDAGISGKSMASRPGLAAALAVIESGDAGTIMASKLDRLSRSVKDFGTLMEQAQAGRWNLCALDVGVDLSSPQGELIASIMASTSRWECRIISVRTADALAQKRAAGVKLGRPRTVPDDVVKRIRAARAENKGWSAIARDLNTGPNRVPTPKGGEWYPTSVRQVALSRGVH